MYQQQPKDVTVSWPKEGPVLTTTKSCWVGTLRGFSSNSREIVVWKARDLALGRPFCQLSWAPGKTASPGHNLLAAQANPPCKGKPIRLRELECTKSRAQNQEGTYPQPSEIARKTLNSKGMRDTMPASLCPWMLLEIRFGSCCCLPPNLFNNKNFNRVNFKF